jgi:hypothetical protein
LEDALKEAELKIVLEWILFYHLSKYMGKYPETRDVALENCLDPKQTNGDQDPEFFLGQVRCESGGSAAFC